MILFENITKRFGKLQVLNGISLQLNVGQTVALLGPNGSGKTTLIKTLLGLVLPDAGSIKVADKSTRDFVTYRRMIGYMPQLSKFPEQLTIGQLLSMLKDIRQDVSHYDEELFDSFQMKDLMDKKLGNLSGGTRQKVSAVIAFLFQPQILILDEPTAGLDPLSVLKLKEKIIAEREKGKLILITSHVLNELDDLVSHVIYLQDGSVVLNESLASLQSSTGTAQLGQAIAAKLN